MSSFHYNLWMGEYPGLTWDGTQWIPMNETPEDYPYLATQEKQEVQIVTPRQTIMGNWLLVRNRQGTEWFVPFPELQLIKKEEDLTKPIPCTGKEGEEQSREGPDGIVTGAYNCTGCRGCQYAEKHSGGWCHMFVYAPEQLPCAQHDCFAAERMITASIIRKNPAMLKLMVMNELENIKRESGTEKTQDN